MTAYEIAKTRIYGKSNIIEYIQSGTLEIIS